MRESKSFVIFFILALSFLVVFGQGCGGGGGGSSDSSDNPGEDVQYSASDDVNYALSHIIIGYQNGDYSEYVTRDVSLPSESEGLIITWSSNNPSVISDSGIVSRPSGSNANVTLTAGAASGDYTGTVDFILNVIQARTRTIEEAKSHEPLTPDDIEAMNESNDNFIVTYDESDELVRHIDGKFTDVEVHNADDALDAIQSVHEILGIDDPYDELEVLNVFRDEYGAQYSFKQVEEFEVYGTASTENQKLEVYGRTVMVSANSSGETDFLSSTVLETSRMNDVYTQFTESEAEQAALNHYEDNSRLEVSSADTRMIVYSLNEYEDEPVLAFLVKVSGTTSTTESGDIYIDEDVIVSGTDLSVIMTSSNVSTWIVNQNGNDEMGSNLTFPVSNIWKLAYYNPSTGGISLSIETQMRDSGTPEVIIYSENLGDSRIVKKTGSTWDDGHQVSAYTNMRTVVKWWKDYFGRNSLDNKGMNVKLVTHERVENWRNNAFWNSSKKAIFVCDGSNDSIYEYSGAMGLDTLTHESTHAVLYYITGGIPYENATGAIDEGYADIFGAFRDEDWKHGWRSNGNTTNPESGITYFRDKTACRRDLRNSTSVSDLSGKTLADVPALYNRYKNTKPTDKNDYNGVHTYSRLIAHAAYLMHQDYAGSAYGLSWYEMRRVWYKSLFMGLDKKSDFHTVRRNVLRAAQQCRLDSLKLHVIRQAFDEVGITMPQATLNAYVTTYNYAAINGAQVRLTDGNGIKYSRGYSDSSGNVILSVDAGMCKIEASASGYETLRFTQYIQPDETVSMYLPLVISGTGSLDVTVYDINGNRINGADVRLCSGWNSNTGYLRRGTTNANGKCIFTGISAGYYTLISGKTSASYPELRYNTSVQPNTTTYCYTYLYPEVKHYIAILYENGREYLNSHLKGTPSTPFHVFSGNPVANLANGRESGRFTRYTSGYEWITFTPYVKSSYVYYVKWDDASDPSWSSSTANVRLYYNNKYLRTYYPPKNNSLMGLYWKVFRITDNGKRKNDNEIVNEEPEAD